MKRYLASAILMITLAACAAPQVRTPGSAETGTVQEELPNPASVYCEQNGNKLEIRTAADGSQAGVCVFPDGGACDEWAYFRGECGPAAENSPTPGHTVATTTAATGAGPGGSAATEEQASGGYMPPGSKDVVIDWWGVIRSTEPGAQFDDYFERQDLGQPIYFGIDSPDPVVQAQIEALRDSGRIVHLYGTLLSNVPDYNGSQILVERIEAEE